MTFALPTSPLPQSAEPSPLVFGGPVLPSLGGGDGFINRLGTRWTLAVETPRLKPEPDGRIWCASLVTAWTTGELVQFAWPQPGLSIGAPGAPLVDGAAQTGNALKLKGMTPGYNIRQGQFFNVGTAGRARLYQARAAAVVDGAGKVTLPIQAMLRTPPANNDVANFAAPIIEGRIIGDARSWQHVIARVNGLKFTIREPD